MRSVRLPAALVALAGMLFLQAAIAFSPCELPGRAAATAMAAAMSAMPGCDSAGQASFGLAHCASEQPAMPGAQPEPFHPVLAPAAAIFPPRAESVISVAWRAEPPQAAGPPPRILFQSFLL